MFEYQHTSIDLTGGNDGTTTTLGRTCPFCGKTYFITMIADHAHQWQQGKYVQEAFPYLNADQREMIISGSHSACFDEAFAEDEDEDDD